VACAAATARCGALAAGGSWAGGVARWGKPAPGREAAEQVRKRHVARIRAAQRQQGGAHGRPVAAACGRGETEEVGREVDEEGLNCNFREMQGPYCNASITFKPVLKWRWAQKQKCMVFQNVQLCFKVHP
jgi:hypothetical protein